MTKGDNKSAPLDASEISSRCLESGHNVDVHVLPTVDSTNSWLMAADTVSPCSLCAAEHQTVGRGRRGKTWHSPDSGVTFSMRFNCDKPVAHYTGLSLLVGAALCDCLRDHGVTNSMVKWPNDILVDDAKLAGILIETKMPVSNSGAGGSTVVIIGIGINYQRGAEARLIDQLNTDLWSLCGTDGLPNRSRLIGEIAVRVSTVMGSDIPQSLNHLVDRWSGYDALAGADVIATVGGDTISGQARGIDPGGGFRLLAPQGPTVLSTAEVSVRKNL